MKVAIQDPGGVSSAEDDRPDLEGGKRTTATEDCLGLTELKRNRIKLKGGGQVRHKKVKRGGFTNREW